MFLVHLPTFGSFESVTLKVKCLVICGNASVADAHVAIFRMRYRLRIIDFGTAFATLSRSKNGDFDRSGLGVAKTEVYATAGQQRH
jgi:hypothetical protein